MTEKRDHDAGDYERIALVMALELAQWDSRPEHGRKAIARLSEITEQIWTSRPPGDTGGS